MSPDATRSGPVDPTSLGRYEIVKKLGQGGMGAVYLARDGKLDREVAIKVLPPELVHDPQAVARFQREAKALAKLSHPGIIQAHDSEEDQGQHFLVMEYVEGTNLAALLQEKGRLAPTLAADYIHQAALALQHAHEKRLVHRDIKPSNLLLTPQRRVKILDLGLARFLQDQITDPSRTREGVGMGTPDYAAPEQFRDARSVGVSADIYALGCTLYHLVTGQVPFPGSSLAEKYQAHEQKEPLPLEELCPEVPAGLALVVRRMMAKRPADRFQAAQECAEALAPYVAGSSLAFGNIKDTGTWQGSQLTLRDHRRRFPWQRWAVAVTVVASLLVLLLIWFNPRHHEEGGQQPGPGTTEREDEPGKPKAPIHPNILTVAQDGTGQFRTIGEALDKVRPSMIIRVLDAARYTEAITLNQSQTQQGITLESPQRATLVLTGDLIIKDVGKVSLRGFRLEGRPVAATRVPSVIRVTGSCLGLLLDELELRPGKGSGYFGINLEGVDPGPDGPPLVIQNCVLREFGAGVHINGLMRDYRSAWPCSRIIVRNNLIMDCEIGIGSQGELKHVQIVGNQIRGSSMAGLQLENILKPTQDILIANNTLDRCTSSFRLWDDAVKGSNIQIRNNLSLQPLGVDWLFVDSGGNPNNPRGPGKGQMVQDAWKIDHNWREGQSPKGTSILDLSWIPPGKIDFLHEKIEGLSREDKNPDFLRPDKESPLAKGGAGGELPIYIGAVPPKGTEPWDWQKTWEARHP